MPLIVISIVSASSTRLRIVAVHAVAGDVLLLELVLQPLDGLVGVRLDGILHLNLQHQVAAALQIETQADVLLEVLRQLRARSWGIR